MSLCALNSTQLARARVRILNIKSIMARNLLKRLLPLARDSAFPSAAV